MSIMLAKRAKKNKRALLIRLFFVKKMKYLQSLQGGSKCSRENPLPVLSLKGGTKRKILHLMMNPQPKPGHFCIHSCRKQNVLLFYMILLQPILCQIRIKIDLDQLGITAVTGMCWAMCSREDVTFATSSRSRSAR